MNKKYKTIYIDPPWMEAGGGKIKRGADKHYPLMKTKDIIILLKNEIVPLVNDDCHLYLWVTNNFLRDGFQVLDALGFKYITKITWVKDKIGLGQYYRGNSEDCLFARKGMLPYKLKNGKRQQGVTSFQAKRKKHSEKPTEMVEMIEKVSHGPYLEVFARKKRSNWDSWGNEIENTSIKEEPIEEQVMLI